MNGLKMILILSAIVVVLVIIVLVVRQKENSDDARASVQPDSLPEQQHNKEDYTLLTGEETASTLINNLHVYYDSRYIHDGPCPEELMRNKPKGFSASCAWLGHAFLVSPTPFSEDNIVRDSSQNEYEQQAPKLNQPYALVSYSHMVGPEKFSIDSHEYTLHVFDDTNSRETSGFTPEKLPIYVYIEEVSN